MHGLGRSWSFYISKRKRVAAARGLGITCTAAAVVSVLWFCFHASASGSGGAERTDVVDDPASPFSRPLFRTGNKTPTIYEDSDSYFLETLSHRVVYSSNVRSADFMDHGAEDSGNAFNLLDDEDTSHMGDNSHAATAADAGAPSALGADVTTGAEGGADGVAFLDVERESELREQGTKRGNRAKRGDLRGSKEFFEQNTEKEGLKPGQKA
ncbi:unnamed protein product, partial [Amoebophrya sp. A25]|eukprot:GSA25T00018069001.1